MIAVSSGHGKHVRGAKGYIDEVDEARRVVNAIGDMIPDCRIFHDIVSLNQRDNVNTIMRWHAKQGAKLNVSIHFNASPQKELQDPKGVEVCTKTMTSLAEELSEAISEAGKLKNRGVKVRTDLGFLRVKNSVLIEVCFVNSKADVEQYNKNFTAICQAIANKLMEYEKTV